MSDQTDQPPPPPDDPPSGSPFPESSLTPPPQDPPPQDPPPRPWMESPAPTPTPAPPPTGGLVGGDPLAGSAPAPSAPPAFPEGYTSPPPPGAGGHVPPPAQAFGSSQPVAGQHVLAGWWRRVGAAVIDGIIVTVPFLIVLSVLGIGLLPDSSGEGAIGYLLGLLLTMLIFAVVALLYAPVMMAMTNGKTVGRMATGIRVVRAGGEPITFGFAALREIAVKALLINAVGGTITFGFAGLIDVLWPLWDDENRALHDFVVNTRTVMDQGA